MDIKREEIIEILGNMGVELPADTKLPLDALQQRLTRAIEHAQPQSKSKEINPDDLKRWHEVSKARLFDVMGTISWKEAAMLATSTTPGGQKMKTPSFEFVNAFLSLRNAVVTIGGNFDEGSKLAVVEDEAGMYGFTMRVVDVYALTDDIPIFTVLYEHGPGNIFTRPSAADFLNEPCPGMQPGQDAVHVKTTFLAQKLLLKVLQMNAGRLPTSYSPSRRANEKKYSLSFLVPISPLSMREVGSLAGDVGCAVCGLPTTSRCAGCQGAAYCRKECQKADWPTHKRECKGKSLAAGSWIDVALSASGYPGMYVQSVNAFSAVKGFGNDKLKKDDAKLRSDADGPPPNIHGDTPFVIKIQVPAPAMGRAPIMIYDRRRSVEFFLRLEVDRKGYEALETTARKTGYLGQKIYRYAKRTGDAKLSICLDREPPAETIKW